MRNKLIIITVNYSRVISALLICMLCFKYESFCQSSDHSKLKVSVQLINDKAQNETDKIVSFTEEIFVYTRGAIRQMNSISNVIDNSNNESLSERERRKILVKLTDINEVATAIENNEDKFRAQLRVFTKEFNDLVERSSYLISEQTRILSSLESKRRQAISQETMSALDKRIAIRKAIIDYITHFDNAIDSHHEIYQVSNEEITNYIAKVSSMRAVSADMIEYIEISSEIERIVTNYRQLLELKDISDDVEASLSQMVDSLRQLNETSKQILRL